MARNYSPDDAAVPVPPWSTALLSQRDVSVQIPINYVTVAGVSLSEACFAHNVYEDGATIRCFSNLLATGFQLFVVDLYWDPTRGVWGLCPVAVPDSTSDDTIVTSASRLASTSFATLSLVEMSTPPATSAAFRFLNRQATASEASLFSSTSAGSSARPLPATVTVSRSNSTSSSTASPVTSPTAVAASPVPSTGQLLYQLGPYRCSSTVELSLLTTVLADYYSSSGNTLQAVLTYLVLNVHAAANSSAPGEPALSLSGGSLPAPSSLLSTLIGANLSSYLYTPSMLAEDRANLNASWYEVASSNWPDAAYFDLARGPGADYTTGDGWPSDSYLEFRRALRLLMGFGEVDPQMSGYDLSADGSQIFPPDTFLNFRNVSLSSSGEVTSGCFFDLSTTSPSLVNNSWAASVGSVGDSNATEPYNTTFPAISNITTCGMSPILNQSLVNSTADALIAPYQCYAYSSLWSWAPGEPRNITSDDGKIMRCAILSAQLDGRWEVADCSDARHAACRIEHHPYQWRISEDSGIYSGGGMLCPDSSTFSVPRTALENAYLLAAVQNRSSDPHFSVWVDLNSLDAQGCWVTGANSSCPYSPTSNGDGERTVVVPTVAAVIVFVIAALTLFVKCAANRQNSRRGRRRRIDQGWEYEGVPS